MGRSLRLSNTWRGQSIATASRFFEKQTEHGNKSGRKLPKTSVWWPVPRLEWRFLLPTSYSSLPPLVILDVKMDFLLQSNAGLGTDSVPSRPIDKEGGSAGACSRLTARATLDPP